jgi:hypothetical protein
MPSPEENVVPFQAGPEAAPEEAAGGPTHSILPGVIERLYKEALKDLEGNLPESKILECMECPEGLDTLDRYNLMLLLGAQTRYFFRMYQAETLSPYASPLHVAQYGLAAGVAGYLAEVIQTTIGGCTPELAEASDKQARAFIHRIKTVLLGKVRGQLILPPGVEGGPEKEGRP